jgi:hypothetical protein
VKMEQESQRRRLKNLVEIGIFAASLIDEHFALLSPWTEAYYQRMVREKSGKCPVKTRVLRSSGRARDDAGAFIAPPLR